MLNKILTFFQQLHSPQPIIDNKFGNTTIVGSGKLKPGLSHLYVKFNMKADEFLTFWPWSGVCYNAGTIAIWQLTSPLPYPRCGAKTRCRKFVLTHFGLYASGVADWSNITSSDATSYKSVTTVTAEFNEENLPILDGTLILTAVSDIDTYWMLFSISTKPRPKF